ncbi:FecR domain-containing protein [Polynucleobacter sp. MWH-Svant-W18]|uniref:FecR family protein n=1 Tax=Polynucleobacter sp. MWH-Svant-W18 TaxID=1855909 RepID=UPI001BFE5695|nr:FecR family protein [Polynucleobacter sp. MWH-Svant-W18]QWD77376.1 FecR domain-containing protein [Polynucleobacter sp. MWH-Svant-W18]
MQTKKYFHFQQAIEIGLGLLMRSILIVFVLATVQTNGVLAQTAPEAGRVLMAIGDVKVSRSGQQVPVTKGSAVLVGDTLVTGPASNAQLRMTDGAILALKAQTEFKINDYNFNGKADGTEKANLSLVKGGVRAVSGVIGKENKDNLKIDAVVATVGIRGTGFNINVCEGNCFAPDKTPVKDGLYAGVFEGKIVVQNQTTTEAVGVNQFVHVADRNSKPQFLLAPPQFLPDNLAGQRSVKSKGRVENKVLPGLAASVSLPTKSSDKEAAPLSSAQPETGGADVSPPSAIEQAVNVFTPKALLNLPSLGNGLPVQATTSSALPDGYAFYMQKAETNPAVLGSDHLPLHNIIPDANFVTGQAQPRTLNAMSASPLPASGQGAYITQIKLDPSVFAVNDPFYSQQIYSIGSAQQMEGGNVDGIISWGRWANGTVQQIALYNSGGPVYLSAGNGFHYIVGDRTTEANLRNEFAVNNSVLNFKLIGATTPTPVGNSLGTWAVYDGSLTANIATAKINGNVAMFNNQSSGYGVYNMAFTGNLNAAAPYNDVSTNLTKVSGPQTMCAAGCAGSGNVTFYGGGTQSPTSTAAKAAGLSYNINTGNNVVQGVAVFKR